MSDARLDAVRDVIQEDVGNRGLRTDPADNLVTRTAGDFAAACRSVAEHPLPALCVVTGFYIPHADPPCGETDGPLGAVFLARALVPLGVKVVLATDAFCRRGLEAGLAEAGLRKAVPLVVLSDQHGDADPWEAFAGRAGAPTHLVALERVGPSHTAESVRAQPGATDAAAERFVEEVPPEHRDRCHTMKGRDISAHMAPAHRLFEAAARQSPRVTTLGIGDGGNEIGMGKLQWDVVRRNVPGGGRVACRVATDHLIVCGISNWGAYGLAAGVRLLRGAAPDPGLFDAGREREVLRVMVENGPLVDGVSGRPTLSVDGLPFERYAEPLRRLGEIR